MDGNDLGGPIIGGKWIIGAQDVGDKIVYSANEMHLTHPLLPAGLFL
jgi:hypothetical protein